MEESYLSEDAEGILFLLFVVLLIVWTGFWVIINLPSDGNPPLLGNYFLNIVLSYAVWLIGIFLLISFFDWIFGVLNKKAKTIQKEEGI